MNCEEARNKILLTDSGELTESPQAELATHLESCGDCRSFSRQLGAMHALITSSRPALEPAEGSLGAIRAAAHRSVRLHWLASPAWRPVLAAAASLMLCLVGMRMIVLSSLSRSSGRNVATEIVPLSAWVMGSEADEVTARGDSAMSLLADQMLILQGLKVEPAEEVSLEATGPEESLPTTLLWRNSPAPLPETRG